MKKILIKSKNLSKEAILLDNETAAAVWAALPLTGSVNRWGEEIYFDIPVDVALAADARDEVAPGELAYWPPGKAFCIFWGPTPASQGSEARAASPVNVFAQVAEGAADFAQIKAGESIFIEAIDG